MLAGELAGGHRVGSVGLPAGTGQVVLHLRRGDPEAEHEDDPDPGDEASVGGHPQSESTQWAGGEVSGRGRGGLFMKLLHADKYPPGGLCGRDYNNPPGG
ncbi:hypothetical protein GCM10007231_21940 [Nocardioides daphniae]|uniref:Uncharacterized protein n=1 Tax=Nocardioides daphniae TaxID=402297 RepID=A0ABQ1QDL1_9ACTN|nr:hypothetical protein GCM10007231_21940 [Nocardioides daphniae]